MEGDVLVVELGLCDGPLRSLGKPDQFRSLAPKHRAATTRTALQVHRRSGGEATRPPA